VRGSIFCPPAITGNRKILNGWSSTRYPGSTSHFCWGRPYRYGGGQQIPGRRPSSASSPTSRRLAGNICCWVSSFFARSISGSRFPRDKRSRSLAGWASWPTIGWQAFTRHSAFGSGGLSDCDAGLVVAGFAQDRFRRSLTK
jgi:hypothetical protein